MAERHAAAQGIAAAEIVVMPRPVSPYNWTVSIFDGRDYRVAHVNTRRTVPLDAAAPSRWLPAFLHEYSAPYQPERLADLGHRAALWRRGHTGLGRPGLAHEAFGFYRWFTQTPALLRAEETLDAQGRPERCAWFRDLRFEFPGREAGPFRYGLCLPPAAQRPGAPARVFKLDGSLRLPV